MRKFLSIVLALLIVAGLTGCDKADDVLHLGLNAIIVEIDHALLRNEFHQYRLYFIRGIL